MKEKGNKATNPKTAKKPNKATSHKVEIGMQVLGGFITALGVTAVASAFVVIKLSTLPIPGLGEAIFLGIAGILGGLGLFATGKTAQVLRPQKEESPVNPPPQAQ